jgi:hypothetical protein
MWCKHIWLVLSVSHFPLLYESTVLSFFKNDPYSTLLHTVISLYLLNHDVIFNFLWRAWWVVCDQDFSRKSPCGVSSSQLSPSSPWMLTGSESRLQVKDHCSWIPCLPWATTQHCLSSGSAPCTPATLSLLAFFFIFTFFCFLWF